jgi:hypothetical protein
MIRPLFELAGVQLCIASPFSAECVRDERQLLLNELYCQVKDPDMLL